MCWIANIKFASFFNNKAGFINANIHFVYYNQTFIKKAAINKPSLNNFVQNNNTLL